MAQQTKRVLVWVISIVLAVAAGAATIFGFGTSIEKYGLSNLVVLVVAFAALFWIWLDYFLKTDMIQK